jgi:hypothetical protein
MMKAMKSFEALSSLVGLFSAPKVGVAKEKTAPKKEGSMMGSRSQIPYYQRYKNRKYKQTISVIWVGCNDNTPEFEVIYDDTFKFPNQLRRNGYLVAFAWVKDGWLSTIFDGESFDRKNGEEFVGFKVGGKVLEKLTVEGLMVEAVEFEGVNSEVVG